MVTEQLPTHRLLRKRDSLWLAVLGVLGQCWVTWWGQSITAWARVGSGSHIPKRNREDSTTPIPFQYHVPSDLRTFCKAPHPEATVLPVHTNSITPGSAFKCGHIKRWVEITQSNHSRLPFLIRDRRYTYSWCVYYFMGLLTGTNTI